MWMDKDIKLIHVGVMVLILDLKTKFEKGKIVTSFDRRIPSIDT